MTQSHLKSIVSWFWYFCDSICRHDCSNLPPKEN